MGGIPPKDPQESKWNKLMDMLPAKTGIVDTRILQSNEKTGPDAISQKAMDWLAPSNKTTGSLSSLFTTCAGMTDHDVGIIFKDAIKSNPTDPKITAALDEQFGTQNKGVIGNYYFEKQNNGSYAAAPTVDLKTVGGLEAAMAGTKDPNLLATAQGQTYTGSKVCQP